MRGGIEMYRCQWSPDDCASAPDAGRYSEFRCDRIARQGSGDRDDEYKLLEMRIEFSWQTGEMDIERMLPRFLSEGSRLGD